MAYYEMGYSQQELRLLYEKHQQEGMAETELAARFGKPQLGHALPPYRFLVDEHSFQGMPDYNQLRAPSYVDSKGREYTPQGGQDPRLVYMRLPKGAPQELDFPNRSELVVLLQAGRAAAGDDSKERLALRVHHVVAQRTATALVQLEDPLPAPDAQMQEQRRSEQRLNHWVSKYKQRFHILEGETQLSSASLERLATRTTLDTPPPRHRHATNLPHAPALRRLQLVRKIKPS